jgi:hypothetical protein
MELLYSNEKKVNLWRKWGVVVFMLMVFFSSVYLFRLSVLSEEFIYLFQASTLLMMVFLISFQVFYSSNEGVEKRFFGPVILLLLGVILSMYTAYIYHQQSYFISMWANRYMFFFLFYIVLHQLYVTPVYLERLLFILGVIYALAFLLQYAVFPTLLFDVRIGVERGTIRLFIPGLAFLNIAYLIALQRVLYRNSLYYFIFMGFFLVVFLLTGTRSIIAGPALVTVFALFFSKRVKSRLGIIVLVFFTIGLAFYLFQDIVLYLVSLSEQQSVYTGEDIRMKAGRFFLTDFFPNAFAYLTGNSEAHQASRYGMEVYGYKMQWNFYQSDVGFIGEFSKYGMFLFISALLIFIKAFRYPLSDNYAYARYFMILILVTLPFGSSFTTPDYIVVLCVVMYLFDIEKNKHSASARTSRYAVYFPEVE